MNGAMELLTHFNFTVGIGSMICVFYLEEAVNMLLGGAVPHVRVRVLSHHVIDGVHDICHLLDKQRGDKKSNDTKSLLS